MRTGISWLDVKLGARMLAKHPGLTLVGGLGMAVAVAIGATFFDVMSDTLHSTLPFEQGERAVAIELRDVEDAGEERRILYDFATWREELESVERLGAWRPIRRNLIVPGGSAGPVTGAAMTASGFRLAGVRPLLGRTFVEADERDGAPPVVVIGHDVWRTHFGGDSAVVGREVRLGTAVHTVVGVMPEGFAFPRSQSLWTPFRADPTDWERGEGPEIFVFGRLAPGATLEEAQAELTTIGRRAAAAFPELYGPLRPRVRPYTKQLLDAEDLWGFRFTQILILLLLIVICVNVAILVYARTATRVGEVAVRSALGASRRRIVGQLFVEALVLSLGAAAVGLAVAGLALGWLDAQLDRQGAAPFWIDPGLSPGTVLYAVGLAVLAAAIVGVAPALKATGRRLQSGLRELGGATGLSLGRTWTALIVVQVAIAVAVLPGAVVGAWENLRRGFARPDFAAESFLTAQLVMDREAAASGTAEADEGASAARYGRRLRELVRRLEAEPGVADVAFASDAPGSELPARFEVDGVPEPAEGAAGHRVRLNHVDVGYFDAFGVPVLAGRGFRPGDPDAAAAPVIVNRAFVEQVLGGRNALGRRVRYLERHAAAAAPRTLDGADAGGGYEIVGVVSDKLTVGVDPGETEARLYHPTASGRVHPATLALRMRGAAPAAFAPRLREIAAAVDPTLQLRGVRSLDEELRVIKDLARWTALAIALITLSVLLLSAAGIHALMSFTVARRRREIGIRAALGADPRRLLAGVLSRALGQLAIGLALGVGAAVLIDDAIDNLTGGHGAVVVPAAAAFMMIVGLVAALGPARRGLRIQPTEALKAEE